jgi:hypothetical protein
MGINLRMRRGGMRSDIRIEGIGWSLGSSRTESPARSVAQGRCAGRLEARPAITLTQGRVDPHGDGGEDGRGIPQPDRSRRHHIAGRTHDDADRGIVRRVRARHAARAYPQRLVSRSWRWPHWRPPPQAHATATKGNCPPARSKLTK